MFANEYFEVAVRDDRKFSTKIDWLVEGIIPAKGVGILLGESAVGKSLLVMHLMATIGVKEPSVLNSETLYPCGESIEPGFGTPFNSGSSLYIAGEGQPGVISRMEGMEKAIIQSTGKRLIPCYLPHPPNKEGLPIIPIMMKRPFKGSDQLIGLRNAIFSMWKYYADVHGLPLKMIVIDTLFTAFEVDQQNDNGEMAKVMQALKAFSEEFKCFVLVVTHPAKSKRADKTFPRGASTLKNDADLVLNLSKINKSFQRELTVVKTKYGACEGMKFRFDLRTIDRVPYLVPINKKEQNEKEIKKDILTPHENRLLHIMSELCAAHGGTVRDDQIFQVLEKQEKHEKDEGGVPLQKASLKKQMTRNLKSLAKKNKIISDVRQGAKFHGIVMPEFSSEEKILMNEMGLQ